MRAVRPKVVVQNSGVYSEYEGHRGSDWNKDL